MTSTIKADIVEAATGTNTDLTLQGKGTGVVNLSAGSKLGGTALTSAFLSPTSDLSGLTGVGATASEKTNIMLNSFRIEEQGGLTVQGMVDGVSDVFTDESGVDTATSTDESYNATSDYYENPGDRLIVAGDFSGDTGAYTLTPSGHISIITNSTAIYDTANIYVGDFDLSWTWTTKASTGGITGMGVAFVLNSAIGSISTNGTGGGFTGTNIPFHILNSDGFMRAHGNGSNEANLTINAGDVVRVTRTSGTFKAYVGATLGTATLVRTMTATSTADVSMVIGTNAATTDVFDDFTFAGTVYDSVIVSDTFTALSQPDTAFVAIWHEDVDSVTLNTDFTIEVSRDAGTTWTAGTTALAATLSADKIITCSIDISAQPAGTSMRWRAKFLNTKSQRLRGVSMQWR